MGKCRFNKEWLAHYQWLEELKDNKEKVWCKLCKKDFDISNKGIAAVTQHAKAKTH